MSREMILWSMQCMLWKKILSALHFCASNRKSTCQCIKTAPSNCVVHVFLLILCRDWQKAKCQDLWLYNFGLCTLVVLHWHKIDTYLWGKSEDLYLFVGYSDSNRKKFHFLPFTLCHTYTVHYMRSIRTVTFSPTDRLCSV